MVNKVINDGGESMMAKNSGSRLWLVMVKENESQWAMRVVSDGQ